MTQSTASSRIRRLLIALAIGALLYFVYLLAFSANLTADDEFFIIDTTDNIALGRGPLLNQTSDRRGLQRTDVEPAQPFLSVPLYWLAYHTLGVGNVHAIFLFNPIATALSAMVVFFYALDLKYKERTALAAALLFGLTTIVVPYAKTFFREPLTMLNLIGAAFFFQRWRRYFMAEDKRHWIWLALGVATGLLALLSKEAALLVLPALLLLAMPDLNRLKAGRRQLVLIVIILAGVALIVTVGLIFFKRELRFLAGRFDLITRLRSFFQNLPHAWYGAAGYLLSPGKSIWMFSPVLLLSLGAPIVLPRNRWRESWLFLLLTLWFAVSYASIRRETWYGGADWGARYMVPLIPFLMVAALPLIERILEGDRVLPKIFLGGLGAGGFIIQAAGVIVNVHHYFAFMQSNTGQPPWGEQGIWNPRWSQAIGSIRYLPIATPDIIWFRLGPDWLVVALLVLSIVIVAAWLVWLTRKKDRPARLRVAGSGLMIILVSAVSIFALSRAYPDPNYKGQDEDLHALMIYLDEQAGPEDVIMLSSPNYVAYFMNAFKGAQTWYSLALSPGEAYSEEKAAEVASLEVEELIAEDAVHLLQAALPYQLLYKGEPIWIVLDHSSFVSWSTRPVEWYMNKYSFPAHASDFGNNARLVEYVPFYAPTVDEQPAHTAGLVFGDAIRLIGYDLVIEETTTALNDLSPCDMLGVSLLWEGLQPIDTDYTFAVYLINADGQPVLQHDRPPLGGFAPTTGWIVGEPLRDNYGFIFPEDLPPGDYEIWVVVYSWPSLERLPITDENGTVLGDHAVLDTITIHPAACE